MDLNRANQAKRRSSKEPIERKVDQWLETGRQFVDGVSGTRPGSRRVMNSTSSSSNRFKKVGRWVGEKVDWLLEDDDDWVEPWEMEERPLEETFSASGKKPLTAKSRRVLISRKNQPNSFNSVKEEVENEWPDDSSFRVQRWERNSSSKDRNWNHEQTSTAKSSSVSSLRPIPKSSRRRD